MTKTKGEQTIVVTITIMIMIKITIRNVIIFEKSKKNNKEKIAEKGKSYQRIFNHESETMKNN